LIKNKRTQYQDVKCQMKTIHIVLILKNLIMELENYCQSCSMPLDNPELLGTEKDGSKSQEYCKFCYRNGAFINPEMTLKEMTSLVISQMEKLNIDSKEIDMAVSSLPNLKRWRHKIISV